MEQKRTLWIIAAVGVFLLFVLGAAMIIYKPAASATNTVASSSSKTSNGWISLEPQAAPLPVPERRPDFENDFDEPKGPGDFDHRPAPDAPVSASSVKVDSLTVYSDNTNVYSKNSAESAAVKTAPTTIDLNVNVTSKSESVASRPAPVKAPAVSKNFETKKAEAKPAAVKVPAQSIKPVQTASVSSSGTKKAVSTWKAPETSYWIQVTALKSRKSADNAREVLDQNKITADVFTVKSDGDELFYRVRVGPYTTRSEAEYWQSKISKIDAFAGTDSYITTKE